MYSRSEPGGFRRGHGEYGMRGPDGFGGSNEFEDMNGLERPRGFGRNKIRRFGPSNEYESSRSFNGSNEFRRSREFRGPEYNTPHPPPHRGPGDWNEHGGFSPHPPPHRGPEDWNEHGGFSPHPPPHRGPGDWNEHGGFSPHHPPPPPPGGHPPPPPGGYPPPPPGGYPPPGGHPTGRHPPNQSKNYNVTININTPNAANLRFS